MPKIKVTSLEFKSEHPFRKLKALKLPIAPRITLICGHNGVGKSTILGLLSSASGLTANNSPKSYFGKQFDASIADIIYIDHKAEVEAPKAAGKLSEPLIHYSVDGKALVKECSLTRRGTAPRARVVARSVPHKKFNDLEPPLGPDAKVPLPTIFLGMARMLPVGESPDSRIQNAVPDAWDPVDEDFMLAFVRKVIPGAGATAGAIAVNRIKLTSKLSTHPSYPYGTRSVSLGQDSLGAIVTALASFNKLKRIQGDQYPGGLLVIDELDAGFHPHAIGVLAEQLQRKAEDLELQIVATTHSPRLIEAIHPGRASGTKKALDDVIYLQNTHKPKFDPSLQISDVLRDMDLVPPKRQPTPEIKIYFEDDEAKEVFDIVVRPKALREIEAELGVKLKKMPLGVGCSSLAMLPSKDPYFYTVVLIVDADSARPKNAPANLVELPGGTDSKGGGLSPERTAISYVRSLVENQEAHEDAWGHPSLKGYSTDSLQMHLLEGVGETIDRKKAKEWWRKNREYLTQWCIYKHWAAENTGLIGTFEARLKEAAKAAKKARSRQEGLAKFGKA
ncbi:AAA family ATPase [Ralstonia sp. CHL-2022]|uniref:AAA family ATPase n=1 Tax=Ralstonia mojiangensis TaxID=2953895 RepID=A0AAE3I7Y3_9RALS|nr:AAA family ATPase [Ralstonia mojiangensis]MCT7319329.1 AAA family ATPase [Ralstonia mojiangensis]